MKATTFNIRTSLFSLVVAAVICFPCFATGKNNYGPIPGQAITGDTTNPSITAPPDINTAADAGVCDVTGISLGTPVTSDDVGVVSVTNDAPSVFPVGTTTVTWTAMDAAGNSATASQMVVVTDDEAPAFVGKLFPVTIEIDPGMCTAASSGIPAPNASDNCGLLSITNDAPAIM